MKDFLKQNGIKFTEKDFTCEACLKGKLHRDSFGKSVDRGKECGDVVHVDVCGPMQTTSLGGSRYMLLLKDDFSRFRFVYLLKEKSEVVERLRAFIKQAEKADGHGIKRLRSDNGTEFVNAAVKRLLEENGIRHQRTVPYTPEQNGVYMSQPVGFDDGSGRICKLVKSLYGLKQASRCWNECFTAFIEDFGFRACESDSCIFIRERGGKRMLLAIYVDDGLIAATSESEIEPVIRHLSERFKVKQLDVEMFLGMEISRRDGGEIHLRQTAYAKKQ